MAYFNTTYEFRTGGLEPDGCSGWIFVNDVGITNIEVLDNEKYSFTEKGDLVLNLVEYGDAGRYYCRRTIDNAIQYEIQLDVHSKSPINRSIFGYRYNVRIWMCCKDHCVLVEIAELSDKRFDLSTSYSVPFINYRKISDD